jgi:two-component system CheB/CheR fusion protein
MSKLTAALESAEDAVIIIDAGVDGGRPMIEYVNKAFSRMFGYESTEVIGKTPELMRGSVEHSDIPPKPSQEVPANGGYRGEQVNQRKDGSEFVAEWHLTRVRGDASGGSRHWVAVIRDMTEKHHYERALQQSEKRARRQLAELEALYRTAPIGLAVFSSDLRFIRANQCLAELSGISAEQHIGRTPRQILPALAEQTEPLLRKVLDTGKPIPPVEIEWEAPQAPGTMRTWRARFFPVLDGAIDGVGAVIEDITEQKRAEQHLELVMHELNHRVKNSLAVVQSLASQTARASRSLAEFEESFIGRIRALANTHTLLTETNWRSAEMLEIVRGALRSYTYNSSRQIDLVGPDLALAPSASLALSMVLHELTSNAAKHGALSTPSGNVAVHWQFADDGTLLRLRWVESGGPKVTSPVRTGFGTQLINFTIKHEFGGSVGLEYLETGMVCEILMPWDKVAFTFSAKADATSRCG